MEEWIAVGVITLIVGGAIAYIVRAKKKGKKCIGCPAGCTCDKKCCGKEKEEGNV